MSKKVIVMEAGSIAQQGEPEYIYGAPNSRFVADFIGSSNFVEVEILEHQGEGCWSAQTPWGRMVCTGKGDFSVGTNAIMAVRPERIEVGQFSQDTSNVFGASLKSRFFLGPFLEYFVEAGGQTLRMQRTSSLPQGPGDAVSLRIDPSYCQIVGLAEQRAA